MQQKEPDKYIPEPPNVQPITKPTPKVEAPVHSKVPTSTRSIVACRAPCMSQGCKALCGLLSELPYDSHFQTPQSKHFCKQCFQSGRQSSALRQEPQDDWGDDAWNGDKWAQQRKLAWWLELRLE